MENPDFNRELYDRRTDDQEFNNLINPATNRSDTHDQVLTELNQWLDRDYQYERVLDI